METELDRLRKMIELFDRDLIQTIAQRFEVVRHISFLKKKESGAVEDPKREKTLHTLHAKWAKEFDVDTELISGLFARIIEESKRIQSSR